MTFSDIVPAMPLIRSGKLLGLATTGPRRAGIAPDIPTMSEAGLQGFNIVAWVGLVAPAGTPKDVVLKIHDRVSRTLKEDALRKRLVDMGIDPLDMSPDAFSDFLRKEVLRWKVIVEEAGIQPQ
jgi:tripartite-type tricarboxylate transporter receptor subunit TctC